MAHNMSSPPNFLRCMIDGAFDATFIVESDGVIWHANEAARCMFSIVDGRGTPISKYLSFFTSGSLESEVSAVSWEDIIHAEFAYDNDSKSLNGISLRHYGDSFPVTISLVRMSSFDNLREPTSREQYTISNGTFTYTNNHHHSYFYCLYIRKSSSMRHQNFSFEDGVKNLLNQQTEELNEIKLIPEKQEEVNLFNQTTAEQQCSQNMRDYQSILLGILDASFHALFVINRKCIIQMVNSKSCEVFGWAKEEFIGKNINMIMTEADASNHDQYLQNYLKTGVKKMIGTQREVTAQRKDGSIFPCVLGLAEPVGQSDYICGFIRDLTSEKESLELIESQRVLLSKVLDASFDALIVIDERGIIQMINEASTAVFGWAREEFIGTNIKMIMPAEHAKRHDTYIQKYLSSGFKKMIGKRREVEALRKDGTTFPCILGLSEFCHNGSRLFAGFIKDVTTQKRLLIAEAEREASDNLLHNMLPVHIAHRLKQDPSHIADQYENTTILFADIVGFTDRTSRISPHDVVTMLNDLFSRFDYLAGVYDLNKVKTIGDCYMLTSIPSSEIEHDGCARVCRFALDIMQEVKAFNSTRPQHGHIDIRVGVATGQVIAGVVGTKRFLFDMWGDAVNVAARMEQHGIPGQIQVTKEVVKNAGSDFTFEFRGTLNIKGKGIMEVFLLKAVKAARKNRSVYDPFGSSSVTTGVMRSHSAA